MKLDDEHEAFRALMRKLAHDHVAPIADEIDRTDEFPMQLMEQFRDQGLIQLAIPSDYGGPGGDVTSICVAREEVARAGSMAMATLAGQNNAVGLPLLQLGTEEQKSRLLPEFAKGLITCVAITEAEAGSDPSGMRSTAVRDGDSWVINGSKSYITWGKVAQYCLVFARTSQHKGTRGISAFIVDTSTPGFLETRRNHKLGQRGLPNVDLRFDNLRVPVDNLLGEQDNGLATALRGLHQNRVMMAAIALGGAECALAYGIDFLRNRLQRGKPLSDHQGLRWMLADLATEIEASRHFIYSCAAELDAGTPVGDLVKLSSMAKYYATETCVKVTNDVVQLLGGAGYLTDHPAERYLRDARLTTIYEGTTQIQKNTIARELLK